MIFRCRVFIELGTKQSWTVFDQISAKIDNLITHSILVSVRINNKFSCEESYENPKLLYRSVNLDLSAKKQCRFLNLTNKIMIVMKFYFKKSCSWHFNTCTVFSFIWVYTIRPPRITKNRKVFCIFQPRWKF